MVVSGNGKNGKGGNSEVRGTQYRSIYTHRISGVTTWGYDQNGNLLELCDADGYQRSPKTPTVYTYNARNQKLTEALPGHSGNRGSGTYDLKEFAYDLVGQPAAFTDQISVTVTHVFDMAGRLIARAYRSPTTPNVPRYTGAATDTDSFTFDDAGRMLTAVSGRYTNTVALAYADQAGRLTSESLSVNFGTARTYAVQNQYDAAGRRTQITYPDSSVVTRSYTARDQLDQIGYNSNMVADFSYDNGGRRTGRTLGDTPGTATTWTYGRSDNLVTSIATPNVASFAYTYDANKNKTVETLGAPMAAYGFGGTTPCTYDNEDRLTGWNRDSANLNHAWSLSAAGDWNTFTTNGTPQTRTHDAVHQMLSMDTTPVSHDAKGNTSYSQSYIWDFDNRLQTITSRYFGLLYRYDALGRRVSELRGIQRPGTTVYVNSMQPLANSPYAGQELVEYVANAEPSAPQRKYVYADYIDEPVMMVNRSGAGVETKYYYPTFRTSRH